MTQKQIDMFAEGACVYEIDEGDNIISIQAWANSDVTARAAFNEIRDRRPKDRFVLKRRAFVMEEHIPVEPQLTQTITLRVRPEIAQAIRGFAIARDQSASVAGGELLETTLASLGLIDGDLTTERLTRFTPTDGVA